jgi:hypothetical protein
LRVVARVTVAILSSEDGEVQGSEPVNGDHEWGEPDTAFHDDSVCGWAGTVDDLYLAGEGS